MSRHNYGANGRAHKILDRLYDGDCGVRAIYDALGYSHVLTRHDRKKFWKLVDVLLADRLLEFDGRTFHILPEGEAALHDLDAKARSVRIFTRAA